MDVLALLCYAFDCRVEDTLEYIPSPHTNKSKGTSPLLLYQLLLIYNQFKLQS